MAWKGRPSADVDYAKSKSVLVASNASNEDPKLVQVIEALINGAQKFKDALADKFGKSDPIPASQLTGVVSTKNGGSYSEKYLPSLTLVANCLSAGASDLYYSQVGIIVTITGRFTVNPAAVGLNTEFRFNLPIKSYFKFYHELAGVVTSPDNAQTGAIIADLTTGEGIVKFLSVVAGVQFDLFFIASYPILEQ